MLSTRILTAVILAGLFIPALFFLPAMGWTALCVLLIAACAQEWGTLSGLRGGWQRIAYIGLVAGLVFLLASTSLPHMPWYVAGTAFWVLYVPWLLKQARMPGSPAFKLGAGALVLVAAGLALNDIRGLAPGLLLMLLAIAWVSDTSAYFAGRAWGRRKLAPQISPGKSWEGVYGAGAAVLVYAMICISGFRSLVMPGWLPEGIGEAAVAVFWIALAIAGIAGDLTESLLKRMAGAKDSGTLLPGHGGILDRVDALLPLLPISAIFYLR